MRYVKRESSKERGPYSHAAASHNIRALEHERKANPKAFARKYPGGRKQRIAVGISKARRGERM